MSCRKGEIERMKKRVWILNHHANSMFFDEGGRHYSFAKYLKRNGYEPVIFCSNAQHGTGKVYFEDNCVWQEHINEKIQVPFVFIKGRPYVGNGKNRILCMLDYYFYVKKAAIQYAKLHGKPDVIIGSQVHPLAIVRAIKLAKKYHVKSIAEIRDLWPESIVAYGIASAKNLLIILLYKLEKWIYVSADNIIFTMGGGRDYIKIKGWDHCKGKKVDLNKVYYINNGVDLENFDYNVQNYRIDDEDLKNNEIIKVVYAGSIRKANNLGLILDIAKEVKDTVHFLIWGSGEETEYIKKRIDEEKITNVIYKGRVEKKYIPYIVSSGNINIMDMQNSNDIFRFGISPNKLFEYLAAGKPIIMYQLNHYNPALESGCGFVANRVEEIVDYLNSYEENNSNCNYGLCDEVRNTYSYKNLTLNLIDIIEQE